MIAVVLLSIHSEVYTDNQATSPSSPSLEPTTARKTISDRLIAAFPVLITKNQFPD
jgi:hypothetical protein